MARANTKYAATALCCLAALAVAPVVAQPAGSADPETRSVLSCRWELAANWPHLHPSSPHDGHIYFMDDHGHVAVVADADGRVRTGFSPSQKGTYPAPLVDDEHVYVACGNGNLRAFSRSDLEEEWSTYVYPPDSVSGGLHTEYDLTSPVTDGSRLYFGTNGLGVFAVDRDTGVTVWTTERIDNVASSLTLHKQRLFGTTYSGLVFCLDAHSGEVVWVYPLDERTGRGKPAVGAGVVIVAGPSGMVYSFHERNGHLHWMRAVGRGVRMNPTIGDGFAYVADSTGTYCIEIGGGDLIWSQPGIGVCAVPFQDWVLVVSPDGELLVLERMTGRVREKHEMLGSFGYDRPIVSGDRVIVPGLSVLTCYTVRSSH